MIARVKAAFKCSPVQYKQLFSIMFKGPIWKCVFKFKLCRELFGNLNSNMPEISQKVDLEFIEVGPYT